MQSADSSCLNGGGSRFLLKSLVKLLAVALLAGALTACVPQKAYHWSLVVDVEQSGKVTRGISVRRTTRELDSIPIIDTQQDYVRGKALVIPMENHKFLFVPMSVNFGSQPWQPSDYEGLPKCPHGRHAASDAGLFRRLQVVPRSKHPTLVAFDDVATPASVKIVGQSELERTFGGNANVLRVGACRGRLQETSPSVFSVLPWLKGQRSARRYLDGGFPGRFPGDPDKIAARDLDWR